VAARKDGPKRIPNNRCDGCRGLEYACAFCVERKRAQNRRANNRAYERRLAKEGRELKFKNCFRCLGRHRVGERYCWLAAEYEPPVPTREESFW